MKVKIRKNIVLTIKESNSYDKMKDNFFFSKNVFQEHNR